LPELVRVGVGGRDSTMTRAVSAQHGALVAETFGALGDGDFVGGSDFLHPTDAGNEKITAAFDVAFGAG